MAGDGQTGRKPTPEEPKRWRGITRDSVLFVVGLLGIAHETLLSNGVERPYLLLLFGAMCGLPLFLRADERNGGK